MFYHKILGGTKYIMSLPVQKFGGMSPHKLGPCTDTPVKKGWKKKSTVQERGRNQPLKDW